MQSAEHTKKGARNSDGPRPRILLIDDEAQLSEMVAFNLKMKGFDVETAMNGEAGLESLGRRMPDTVLLDVRMPGIDGFEVLRRIRALSAVPVIMLTARGDVQCRVRGLSLGANDYIVKPCSLDELAARIRVQLRNAPAPEAVAESSGLEIDEARGVLRAKGRQIALPASEMRVLHLMASRCGRTVTHGELALLAPNASGDPARAMRVTISKLRAKLRAALGRNPIRTVYGIGYVFSPAPIAGPEPEACKGN